MTACKKEWQLTKLYPQNIFLFMLPALLVALLYWPSLSFSLVWDDTGWVNRIVALQENFPGWLAHAFTSETLGVYYRPLVLASFYYPFNLPPPVFFWHLASYSLYVINILLLGWIFLFLLKNNSNAASSRKTHLLTGVVLLLFTALHPTQVETAVWVSARFDLLCNTFLLLVILVEVAGVPRIIQYILQPLFFFLALLSKETAIVFLGIYPIFCYYLHRQQRTGFVASIKQDAVKIVLLGLCAAVYLCTWYQMVDFQAFANRIQLAPLYTDNYSHLLLVLGTLGYFLRVLVYPFVQLSPFYYHEGNVALSDPHVWAACCFILLVLFVLIKSKQHFPALGIVLVSIFPFLNWSQISSSGDIFQNRYLSLPLLLASIVGYLFLLRINIPEKLHKWAGLLVPYFLLMVFTTLSIMPLWKSNISLWRWVVAENPRSVDARNNLASELIAYQQYDDALLQLQASIQIQENFLAYSNMAEILWAKGDYANANIMAFKSFLYPSVINNKLVFVLRMANNNLLAGDKANALLILQRMPAHYFKTEMFNAHYEDILGRLDRDK